MWTTQGPTAKKVRHVAYGYTLMVNGKQERKVSRAWQKEAEALEALAKRQREVGAGVLERPERTLGKLAEEHLTYKADYGKRIVVSDRHILMGRLLPALGAGLPIRMLTSARIAQYEKARMATTAKGRERKVSAYTVANEPAVLRHMLRLARRWGYVETVPEIMLSKKPEGHLRYLEADEISKLLDACRYSRNPYLLLHRDAGDQHRNAERGDPRAGVGAQSRRVRGADPPPTGREPAHGVALPEAR